MDNSRTPETEALDRDPRTGAPTSGGADGTPDSPLTPGGEAGEGETEDQADPSLSIESVNGEDDDAKDGGMVGEGGA